MVNMEINDKFTEDKIFKAAIDVFLIKGMDGARMQDIADQAGVNKSLLHYYFRTKERLFNIVFEKLAMKMILEFSPILNQNMTLEDKIKFFFKEHIALLQKNPGLPAFVLNEINRNPERIKKFIAKVNVNKFWETLQKQHSKELGSHSVETLVQILITIASMSIFPFVARGLIEGLLEKTDIQFDNFIEVRKEFAAEFVMSALTNKDFISNTSSPQTKNTKLKSQNNDRQ